MKELCSQCEKDEKDCWFMKEAERVALNHNKKARELGTNVAMNYSDLSVQELNFLADTELLIEQLREETLDDCPNLLKTPDYIGKWFT